MNLKDYIRSIPDYPKKGILFRDITTLIKHKEAFANCIDQIVEKSKNFKIDKIAAIESRGFVFASALCYNLSKSLILMRKKNKLPAEKYSQEFECSLIGNIQGSIYGDLIAKLEDKKQITRCPIDPGYPVNVAWDLGYNDATALIFFQQINCQSPRANEVHAAHKLQKAKPK